jgi:hypothetical protein
MIFLIFQATIEKPFLKCTSATENLHVHCIQPNRCPRLYVYNLEFRQQWQMACISL